MDVICYKVADFEGPLDLLLTLISKNKMNIYDINITELLTQYMKQIELFKENNPNYLVSGMEVGAKYYIVLGVVNNNDIYFMLYKETANGEELVASATWDYANEIENKVVKDGSVEDGTAVYANFENAGNFIISLYTPSVTKTITVAILTASEANALIAAIPSQA